MLNQILNHILSYTFNNFSILLNFEHEYLEQLISHEKKVHVNYDSFIANSLISLMQSAKLHFLLSIS